MGKKSQLLLLLDKRETFVPSVKVCWKRNKHVNDARESLAGGDKYNKWH